MIIFDNNGIRIRSRYARIQCTAQYPLGEPLRLECNRVRGYHTQDCPVPMSWSHHPVTLHLIGSVCRGRLIVSIQVRFPLGFAIEALIMRLRTFSFIVPQWSLLSILFVLKGNCHAQNAISLIAIYSAISDSVR